MTRPASDRNAAASARRDLLAERDRWLGLARAVSSGGKPQWAADAERDASMAMVRRIDGEIAALDRDQPERLRDAS